MSQLVSGLPHVVVVAVAFPLDEVLVGAADRLVVQDDFDFEVFARFQVVRAVGLGVFD